MYVFVLSRAADRNANIDQHADQYADPHAYADSYRRTAYTHAAADINSNFYSSAPNGNASSLTLWRSASGHGRIALY